MVTASVNYRVGSARVTRIPETSMEIAPARLYVNWRDVMRENGSVIVDDENEEPLTISVHTWVVEYNGRTVVVDTGVGNMKERSFSPPFHHLNTPYLQKLEAMGVYPEKVDLVLLTHLHTDHIGWNTYHDGVQWRPTFPNARYIFSQAELDFFKSPAAEERHQVIFEDSIKPVIDNGKYETVSATGGVFEGFRFHPTPGHSVGHMSISFGSDGENALFTGDVAHNPIQIYYPELTSIFCADGGRARMSRLWVMNYGADHNATLFTAHFPETSAGKISNNGKGFEWSYV